MKIALCVRYDCNNYGSMLQILATQNSLSSIGFDYEILRYDKMTPGLVFTSIPRLFNADFIEGKFRRVKKKILKNIHSDVKKGDDIRKKRFSDYRIKYIGPFSKIHKGYDAIVSAASEYDAVLVGSDQLWAPAGLESNYYNLIFVPDDIIKISYATSFGVSAVPTSQKKKTAYYLNRIDYISVREQSGAKIVKELTGKNAVVAADPTLMLTKGEWDNLIPFEQLYKDKYIFAYFLGNNEKHRQIINALKEKTGLKVVTCPHMDSYNKVDINFGDIQRYDTGPEEFLNLIRGAEYIFTDSFHGTIFSILNHKQFLTFERFKNSDKLSKNSRIESLLDSLSLQQRKISSFDVFDILKKLKEPIDYDLVDKKLENIRQTTFSFLNDALISIKKKKN